MSSIRISQLTPLVSASFTGDDFFPVVDSASMTTYRTPLSSLNSWLGVYGTASWASGSRSASYANTSSFSVSSSWAPLASLQAHTISSSWASSSISASHSQTASSLQGYGNSWENSLTMSKMLYMAVSSSFIIPRKRIIRPDQGEPLTQNCLFLNSSYSSESISNDWGRIYYTEPTLDVGRVVFEHGDNADGEYVNSSSAAYTIEYQYRNSPGFLFSTLNTDTWFSTSSLLFLSTAGKLYARGIEANDYTASVSVTNGAVGFYGTASYARTASYVSNLPTAAANVTPSFVKNLSIRPNWTPYDTNGTLISIKIDEIIVYDVMSPKNAKKLSSDDYTLSMTNNRAGADAGGLIGVFTPNHWYDVWVVHNSAANTVSTAIIDSGTTPKTSTSASVHAALNGAGYDYFTKIGSVFDENSIVWRQWYEYGLQTMWAYRNIYPLAWGLGSGYNLTHYLNSAPRNTKVKLKINKNNSYLNSKGYTLGDELDGADFLTFLGTDDIHLPPFILVSTDTTLKFWASATIVLVPTPVFLGVDSSGIYAWIGWADHDVIIYSWV